MQAEFTYTARESVLCRHCGAKADLPEHLVYRGGLAPLPTLPVGWSVCGDSPICPKHRVEVNIIDIEVQ